MSSFGVEQAGGDEAVPGTDALLAVDHQQGDVGVGQLLLDPALHAAGQLVARPLDAGQVDQHDLGAGLGVGRDAADRPPGGLRPDRGDRHGRPDQRVDQGRLADVRPAGETDEARPGRAFGQVGQRVQFGLSHVGPGCLAVPSALLRAGP